MKKLLPVLLCFIASGCAHKSSYPLSAYLVYYDGGTKDFRVNFRDDRLLFSDVFLSGQIQEWKPLVKENRESYFGFTTDLEAKERISDIRLVIEQGSRGSSSFSSIILFQASDFIGKTKIAPFEIGGISPKATLFLYFKQGDEERGCYIQIAPLLEKTPNL